MKKTIFVLSIIITLLTLTVTTYAADILYMMLHADDGESYKDSQDTIIVGRLIDKKNNKFSVKVMKVISGKIDSDLILVDSNLKYGWTMEVELIPNINDYCVMSLKKYGSVYRQAFGTFKADSGDYKTLKLLTKNIKYLNGNADVACIEWYVNSGGTEKEFSFIEGKAFVNRPNGESIQIYPKLESKETTTVSQKLSKQTINLQVSENENNLFNSNKTILFFVFATISVVLAIIIVSSRKRVKRN